ncbi:prenyltransferase/squalene oxidase repeat-containing protein [Prosthecobacter sp.]|uniref:prenyltransferase/squalene oxidase repeat-containing protein n=1 Tax=Prosthecobacter sp. TaxID=1965333 RepID=UPI002ABAFCE4|nr:prenyltransferase/squalene oxidase repeat-containing protein [Prosthecobacter sp.]MDZ4401142.1 prenyltransferase/squalene oxidase repeat-containing protein [Prosthecobacter sp.]
MVALSLAVMLHLLFLGLLVIVVEIGEPAPQAEILAFTQAETPAQTPNVSKPMPADALAMPPTPQIQDSSIHGTMTLPRLAMTVSPTMRLGEAKPIFNGGGGMGVPLAMRSRGNVDNRLKLLTKRGGLPGAEDAVQRALDWLGRMQNEDGSWGKTYKVAMTGFAVLCFLGHGDTVDSAKYGREVTRGVHFLTEVSAKNEGLLATVPRSNGACYEHGIATYALGEVYAMARFGQKDLGPVVEAFDSGVRIILKGQTEAGGWLYNYRPGPNGDMSVTGWQYQALKAARQTRLNFPTLEQQIHKTERFLLHMRGPRGGFGYQEPADRESLTGAGVLGLQMFNPQEHRMAIIEGLQFILSGQGKKRWSGADVYAWYYNTQAAFNFGGTAWERWNAIFQKELLQNQQLDGHWSHRSASKAKFDSDLFCTVLCTLMLEVYYRYELPPSATR